jgi:hypothetical protein
MADEQYKWLDRETAERLLRGESLETVDPSARDQAERLSAALGALSAQAAPAPGELPGEQAALAAFRKAREAADAERTAARASGSRVYGADAGLVRIGAPARSGIPVRRPRWGRPVRLALAAVVAVGAVGGVAMAAGTGILPTPFAPERPGPAASVSADGTSGAPLSPASPQGTAGTSPGPGAPSGGAGASRGGSGEAAGPDGRTGTNSPSGSGAPTGASGNRWKDATAACRDLRAGKDLDSARRRALENLAGGSSRVSGYCKAVLATAGSGEDATGGDKGAANGGGGNGKGNDKGKGGDENGQGGDDEGNPGRGGDGHPGDGHGTGQGDGKSGGKGDSQGNGKGHHAVAPARTTTLGPTPSPTYTAL